MEENNKGNKGQSIRILALVLGVLAIFVVFGAQLVNWQLVQGAQYREKADSTNIYTVKPTPPGEILDANGVSLAVNETGYKVVFNKLYADQGLSEHLDFAAGGPVPGAERGVDRYLSHRGGRKRQFRV